MSLNRKSDLKNCNRIDNTIKKRKIISSIREQDWLKENKEAIEKQNERMKREGSLSDVYRRF